MIDPANLSTQLAAATVRAEELWARMLEAEEEMRPYEYKRNMIRAEWAATERERETLQRIVKELGIAPICLREASIIP